MNIYRKARKQILLAAFTLVAAFAWGQDTSFCELVMTATPEEVRAAIKRGADIKTRDDIGWTPLMYAASDNENPEVITTLLDAGADGKARDKDGKTAFDHATENEHLKGTDAYWQLNDARF